MASSARLPDSYIAARNALQACARHFTPEGYGFARIALAQCLEADETVTWPADLDTLKTECRMANDDEIMRLVRRVERLRAEWRSKQVAEEHV